MHSGPAAAHCVVCEATIGTRAVVRLARYGLIVCQGCGTWNISPRPDAAAQTAHHDSAEYDDHPYLEHRRRNLAALDRRSAAIVGRVAPYLDLSRLRGQRVLDVGCDTGQFVMSIARQYGVVPVGLDVARRAVASAKAAGLEAYHCTLEQAPANVSDFPLITAIDVIEHVPDVPGFFRELAARLRPGGVAYVETPNVESTVYRVGRALAALTGGHPAGVCERLFPAEHIQYFLPAGIDRIAQRSGLTVVEQGSRELPLSEIAVGWAQRMAIGALQTADAITHEHLLRWAVLQRPASAAGLH
jgi:2-polyprenyl-3-methyl-5-hydroxy-6-metoxy-1,4-benzoquinol methylase